MNGGAIDENYIGGLFIDEHYILKEAEIDKLIF
jgi:hypothetical protein